MSGRKSSSVSCINLSNAWNLDTSWRRTHPQPLTTLSPFRLYSGEFQLYEAEIQFSNVKKDTKDDLPESTREKYSRALLLCGDLSFLVEGRGEAHFAL